MRGRRFHDDYRAMLRAFDGWDHFLWSTLFGTSELSGGEYDDSYEVFTYGDDPIPDELAKGLLIGASENDGGRVLLLESGEVVDWLYEETNRHPDLASFLLARQADLLSMRKSAELCRARVEREWDTAERNRREEELERELDEVLARHAKTKVKGEKATNMDLSASLAPPLEDRPSAVKLSDLVILDKASKIVGEVGLGVVLYLGAAPTHDEVMATYAAFRKRFPVKGAVGWVAAAAYAFFPQSAPDADDPAFVEELGEAIRVDDQGHFGLRIFIKGEPSEVSKNEFFLNVRATPPQSVNDDDGEPTDVPRASFCEVFVPASADPHALHALARDLVDILPVRSGHGGYFAMRWDQEAEPNPFDQFFLWCRRLFGIDLACVDEFVMGALRRARGAGWLTILGSSFTRVLDRAHALELSKSIQRDDGKYGTLFRATATPTLGDVKRGEFPEEIAEIARAIEPLALAARGDESKTVLARHGIFSVGGVYFSTFTSELPGAFGGHRASVAFLRRFTDPRGFIGPTARETGIQLLEEVCAPPTLGENLLSAWRRQDDKDGPSHNRSFNTLLRSLFNASYLEKTTPLAIRALEFVARYPDDAPKEAFNNLLFAYNAARRTDDAIAIMPVALEVAKRNSFIYHNAACALVAAGKLAEAVDCVRFAIEAKYPHVDRISTDEDLAPLFDRADFKALW